MKINRLGSAFGLIIFFAVVIAVTLSPTQEENAVARAENAAESDAIWNARFLEDQTGAMDQLRYFKDKETGLCFARTGFSRTATMAHVPCDNLDTISINSGR